MNFNLIPFLTYVIVTAGTPGPNNITSMSNASRLGLKKSYPFNLGIWVGFSIVAILCTIFVSLLSSLIPKIKVAMLIVGAVYMLYLAWKTFKSSGDIEESHSSANFFSGLFLQFINAKIYIYCIVSMQVYILPYYGGQLLPLFGFAIMLATIGFLFTLLWAVFGSVFKLLFSKYAKLVNTIMALLLVYCAISLFL